MAQRVLFICKHNSARSQMAEAFLDELGNGKYEAHSAGLEPTVILPEVVEVMAEEGIDLSRKTTRSVFDLFKKGELFEYVITVCDSEVDTACPVFPGMTERLLWPFPDPADVMAPKPQKLDVIRQIRNAIKEKVQGFIDQ